MSDVSVLAAALAAVTAAQTVAFALLVRAQMSSAHDTAETLIDFMLKVEGRRTVREMRLPPGIAAQLNDKHDAAIDGGRRRRHVGQQLDMALDALPPRPAPPAPTNGDLSDDDDGAAYPGMGKRETIFPPRE